MKKLETVQVWASMTDQMLAQTLEHGFHGAFKGGAVSFCTDPIQAVKEGHPETNMLLLARVALGREGAEYKMMRGKYIIQNTKSCLAAFLVTFAKVGDEEKVLASKAAFSNQLFNAFSPNRN